MSEKGVLSKSIASNISEAIIDKLGGTGYAPTEWSKNINLLGIASADIEEALASITEDTSSADKGLLSLSIASDVGAMLNKKYNTSRGFKPCEVSSAVSALAVLPEKTASSAPICTFSDGADDVPLKSCEVALSASLDGYSSVTVHHTDGQTPPVFSEDYTASLGRTIYGGTPDVVKGECEPTNWLDDTLANLEQGSINGSTGANENANNRVRNASAIPFPYDEIVSSYTWTIPSGYKVAIRPYDENGNFVQLPSWALAFITQLPQDLIGQGITQMRFILAKTDNSAITPSDMAEVGYILNKGNTAEAYSPYFAPFTFEPVPISSRLGNNTMWSEQGDTEVTYRADLDLYEAPSTLLGSNNTETEGNEEQEVNE